MREKGHFSRDCQKAKGKGKKGKMGKTGKGKDAKGGKGTGKKGPVGGCWQCGGMHYASECPYMYSRQANSVAEPTEEETVKPLGSLRMIHAGAEPGGPRAAAARPRAQNHRDTQGGPRAATDIPMVTGLPEWSFVATRTRFPT